MKNAVSKILEINEIVKTLDVSLQERASDILLRIAFEDHFKHLQSFVGKDLSKDLSGSLSLLNKKLPIVERPVFFEGHEHDRLKDNVHLIVAWLYSKHGVLPVETKFLRMTAQRVGLAVPNRPDNTMRQAKCKGHSLYKHIGRGWQLTELGERYIQQRYGVKKGTLPMGETNLLDEIVTLEDTPEAAEETVTI
jgi:hypothetical protein